MYKIYQQFIDSQEKANTKKVSKRLFTLLDTNKIMMDSTAITTVEQLESVFIQCQLNSFNQVITYRSVLKSYARFIHDEKLFALIVKVDIYRVLQQLQPNMKRVFIHEKDFQEVYNSIGSYEEDTFNLNILYFQTLFWCVYAGVYNEDMSVLKNLRSSDVNGNIITCHPDNEVEWQLEIPQQLVINIVELSKENCWRRKVHRTVCEILIEGLYYDSVFKVETRGSAKVPYVNSYYTRLRKLTKEYIGYTIAPQKIFLSGLINRIKQQYGKSDDEFSLGVKHSDPELVALYQQEAKRCHYNVAFWNFRQTIMGRI